MDSGHHGMHDHIGPTSTQMPPMSHDAHGPAHTAMEHSSMDHSFMDHGTSKAHDTSSLSMGPMSMHAMVFHFGYDEKVLFESWKISNIGGLIGSMVGIFIMAALYEGLKYYREYLFWRTYNSIQYRSVTTPDDKTSVGTSDHRIVQVATVLQNNTLTPFNGAPSNGAPSNAQQRPDRPTMLSWAHALQTCLHIIQVVISYFLMLIFMTYNVWLCLAVLVGAATGYFLFGWKKSVVVDVTEHCH